MERDLAELRASSEADIAADRSVAEAVAATLQAAAGGMLRMSIRPPSNALILLLLLRMSVCAFTLTLSHAPMSVDCLFLMTLLRGRR